jgi:predicted RNA-binding protein Jag
MSSREFSGRSAAEAAIKACGELGVSRSALKYQVVSETGAGLEKQVVISVNADQAKAAGTDNPFEDRGGGGERRPREDRGPRDRDDRPPRDEGRRSDSGAGLSDRSFNSSHAERDDAQPRENALPRDDAQPRDEPRRDFDGNRGPRGDRGRGGRSDRGGRGGRGDRGGRGGRDRDRGRGGRGDFGDRPRRDRDREGESIESLLNLETLPTTPAELRPDVVGGGGERAKRANGVLAEMLTLSGLHVEAHLVQDGPEEIVFDLRGADEAKVIGKKGETLLSMQFLVNRMITRQQEEGEQHIVLDAANYRTRRREALAGLATKLAGCALEEHKVVRLSPMSAHDRRIFHITLHEKPGITTRSEGDGLYRPLLIIPTGE